MDGQIWSLECDLNIHKPGYITLSLVSASCRALKLNPPHLVEIKVELINIREPHLNIKKTLALKQLPSDKYSFSRFARIEDVFNQGFIDSTGSINFRFQVKRYDLHKKLQAANLKNFEMKQKLMDMRQAERMVLTRTKSHIDMVTFLEKYNLA